MGQLWFLIGLIVLGALGIHEIKGKAVSNAEVKLNPRADENGIDFEIGLFGEIKLKGRLGLALPLSVGQGSDCSTDPNVSCVQYGDFAKVSVIQPLIENDNCAKIEWTSQYARELQDCFTIEDGMHMYGGGETKRQYWPINQEKRIRSPYVTGDFLQNQDVYYGGVVENYWLLSTGAAIHVDEDTPLFMSYGTERENQICFTSADQYPYKKRDQVTLKYSVCVDENIKKVHQTAIRKFYEKPTAMVDEQMLLLPLWCTWAQFKTDVNQVKVLEYARRVVSEGFAKNSHIEIDDNWETCYGNEDFDRNKFPDPSAMVQEINSLDMRVTVWIHPFVNYGCPVFQEGVEKGYFIKDPKGKTGITSWWAGSNSGVIDVTNEEAVNWWKARLDKLKTDFGISSFKFDAGETNWLPYSVKLNADENLSPIAFTTKYVEIVSSFGGLVEVRSGRRNQNLPIFTRMLDKDSNWGYENGLKSMIPTLLFLGTVGYPFVLPDMIGGNAYAGWPSKELFIRWIQANVFMPAVQFSIVPWDDAFDPETVEICKKVLLIREKYHKEILAAAQQAIVDGTAMNLPMWYVDPTDPETFTIDSQYMLGETILVAPVLDEGAVTRDIYLPAGQWISGVDEASFTGPTWIRNHSAPLDIVPYFIKQ